MVIEIRKRKIENYLISNFYFLLPISNFYQPISIIMAYQGGQSRTRRGGPKGFDKKDEFDSKLLDLSRVERMRAGGRRLRFRAAIVVGDKMGKVGFGEAKGKDVAQAIEKATRVAKKDLFLVPMVDETISHTVEAKFGAAKILMKPQKKGRGLVAGGTIRIICNLAGIKNISSKAKRFLADTESSDLIGVCIHIKAVFKLGKLYLSKISLVRSIRISFAWPMPMRFPI